MTSHCVTHYSFEKYKEYVDTQFHNIKEELNDMKETIGYMQQTIHEIQDIIKYRPGGEEALKVQKSFERKKMK